MENQTIMDVFIQVIKDSLQKQAFSVVLLIIAVVSVWQIRKEDKVEFMSQISSLNERLNDCSRARESQSVKIATLEEKLSRLAR